MKILIRIFRTFWGLWHLLWYAFWVIIFSLFHIVLAPFGERAAKPLMFLTYRVAARCILYSCLHRIKNHGLEDLDTNRNYMVVGNHSSNLDFYTHPCATPVYVRTLVKKELTKIPFFGRVMKNLAVPVERGNKESGKEGLKQLREKLDMGYSLFIYPEGTRNRTDALLGEFKSGAFRMAVDCQIPILISTIANARQINDIRRGLDCRPGTVHIHWDKPLETQGMTRDDIPELMEKTRQLMLEKIRLYENEGVGNEI